MLRSAKFADFANGFHGLHAARGSKIDHGAHYRRLIPQQPYELSRPFLDRPQTSWCHSGA